MKYVTLAVITFVVSLSFMGFKSDFVEGNVPYQSKKNVTFKLIQTYGANTKPKEAMLANVRKIAIDNKNNLYILDQGDKILSFGPDGSFRWILSNNGGGPGDLSSASGIATDGEKYIYVSNINDTRIDKFDLNGKFVTSTNVSNLHLANLNVVGFIKPNLLVTMQFPYSKIGADIVILDLSKELKIRNRFMVDETENINMYNTPGMWIGVTVNGDKICTGNYVAYKTGIFDINGIRIKTIKREFKKFVKPFISSEGAAYFSVISPPYKINQNFYLCFVFYPSGNSSPEQLFYNKDYPVYANMIDIQDEQGNLLFSAQKDKAQIAEFGKPIYSDSEGYLYTFKELPYPQVCKYKVIIEDKK